MNPITNLNWRKFLLENIKAENMIPAKKLFYFITPHINFLTNVWIDRKWNSNRVFPKPGQSANVYCSVACTHFYGIINFNDLKADNLICYSLYNGEERKRKWQCRILPNQLHVKISRMMLSHQHSLKLGSMCRKVNCICHHSS